MTSSPLAISSVRTVGRIVLVLFLFLVSSSQLLSIQLDKVAMLGVIGLLLFNQIFLIRFFSPNLLLMLVGVAGYILLSYLLNFPDSSLIIFFPVVGFLFVGLASEENRFIDIIYWALFIHIVLGILFVFSSYLVGINSFVHPMFDKGLPFLHAAKGFTTTVQSFGTLVLTWLLIFYWKEDQDEVGFLDKIIYWIVILGLLLTFNRNSFLVFYVLLFFRHRRVFVFSIIIFVAIYLYYFNFINKLIFNMSTLTSRADLLEAFRIAFFEKTDWLRYLIGNGNNMIHESISRRTFYSTRYIENGTSVLLYTYGFIGYLIYLISSLSFSVLLFLKTNIFYSVVFLYFFIVAQQFTHEFFSTTIYLLLIFFVSIVNSKLKIR